MSDPVLVTREHLLRLHYRLQEKLPMWVVYNKETKDYPGLYVARMHLALPEPMATRFVMTHESLHGLRELLPPGLCMLKRAEQDEPTIIEIWL
jgi:hypothetical protein